MSLSRKYGFCYATNKYLAKLNNVCIKTISNSITKLNKKNYIRIEISKNQNNSIKRKIYLTEKGIRQINQRGMENKFHNSVENNCQYNNRNNKSINNKISIIPEWFDKDIKINPLTKIEKEELEELIKIYE